jgi:hypothetical protein
MKQKVLQWDGLDLVSPNSFGRCLRADKVLVAFKHVLKGARLPERRLQPISTQLIYTPGQCRSCLATLDST